jgi:flagellar motor switch protein FliG
MSAAAATAPASNAATLTSATLTGPKKAALFMMALSEEQASRIFERLRDEEIRDLSLEMSNLGKVEAGLVEKVMLDFVEAMGSNSGITGTLDSTERLLAKVLGKDRSSDIMDDIRGPAGRTMWDKLSNVNEVMLANYLKNEYPQTVAVVLSKIDASRTAKVLGRLPESMAFEVIMRLLRLEPVQKEILQDIERTLRTEFMNNLAKTNRRDPYEMIAEVFNNFDRSTEARFMAALEERNKDSAERIKNLMFTFEELDRLDSASMQIVMRSIDKSKLPLALKGASEDLRNIFFSNMSERAAKLLKEEIAGLGPVRLRDVEDAQQHIVQTTKDLSARDEIIIPKSGAGAEDEILL